MTVPRLNVLVRTGMRGRIRRNFGLVNVLIWRALRATWAGELDSLWPWSARMRAAIELLVAYSVAVAAGSLKAHTLNGGTWPAAVLYSALLFGGVGTLCFFVWLVEHFGRGSR